MMRVRVALLRTGIRFGSLKRRPAPTASHRIRILDAETRSREPVRKVQRRAPQVLPAFLIHKHLHPVAIEDKVPVLALIQRHAVLKSGATPMFNEDAQPLPRRLGLLGQKGLKLFDRAIGYNDHELPTLSDAMIEVKRAPYPVKPVRSAG